MTRKYRLTDNLDKIYELTGYEKYALVELEEGFSIICKADCNGEE